MRVLRIAAPWLCAACLASPARGADAAARAEEPDRFELSAEGETYIEVFRRALLPGAAGSLVETDTALPIHQYVHVRARDVDTSWKKDALDVELAAYGRLWPGDSETERLLDGDVQVANVGYQHDGFELRLGRQVHAGGAARYVRYDGLSLGARFGFGLSVEAYGGLTALPRFDARPGYHHLGAAQDTLIRDPDVLPEPTRTGHRLGGGRVSYSAHRGALGISFHEQHEEGELAHRNLGADGRLVPFDELTLAGSSVLDLDGQGIADARLWADVAATQRLDLSAEYLHAEPALYLSRQSVLSVFSTDAYDEAGARVSVRPLDALAVTGGSWVSIYDNEQQGGRGQLALRLTPGRARLTVVGLSYTRLVAVDNGYHSARASLAQRIAGALSGTLEAHAFFYDEEISGRSTSTVYAGTLSYAFSRALNVLWGTSVARSPYASFDAQTLLRASYAFDASNHGEPL